MEALISIVYTLFWMGVFALIIGLFWAVLHWRRYGRLPWQRDPAAPQPARRPRPAVLGRTEIAPPAPAAAPQAQGNTPARQPAPAPPPAADLTRLLVGALPASVAWPRQQARLSRLPVLYDGTNWRHLDLTASRHAVICGGSRSGKGNLVQLLALMVLEQGPDAAEVWALDPKGGLDYAALLALPHARVYADCGEGSPFSGNLLAGYRAALAEMARRNRLLLDAGARNHREYRARTGQQLPILVIIADEVADLTSEQAAALATLARMSAASGIVLWTLTQYPTSDVLSRQIQVNSPDRVVFRFPGLDFTKVALALGASERPTYEPGAIATPGVAILRQDGRDVAIGRVPELGDQLREQVLAELVARYGHRSAAATTGADAATRSATEGATPPVAGGEAEIGPESATLPAPEAPAMSDTERDELIVRLARNGEGQRAIRAELRQRGLSIAQDRLVELYRRGRAERAAESPEDSPGPAALAA